jgi:hypothetical protein
VKQVLVLVIFTLLYFAARIPVYPEKMLGEDGSHAAIFLKQPRAPLLLLEGRVGGKDIFAQVSHPVPTFLLLEVLGSLTPLPALARSLSPFWVTTWSRVGCSLYQLLAFLLLLVVIFRNAAFGNGRLEPISLVLVFVFSLAPIAGEAGIISGCSFWPVCLRAWEKMSGALCSGWP